MDGCVVHHLYHPLSAEEEKWGSECGCSYASGSSAASDMRVEVFAKGRYLPTAPHSKKALGGMRRGFQCFFQLVVSKDMIVHSMLHFHISSSFRSLYASTSDMQTHIANKQIIYIQPNNICNSSTLLLFLSSSPSCPPPCPTPNVPATAIFRSCTLNILPSILSLVTNLTTSTFCVCPIR